MNIELGMVAKDRITGFEGVVTGHCRHLTGCDTYGLAAQELKDGKTVDVHWFDVNRLEIIDESGVRDIYEKAHPELFPVQSQLRAASGGPNDAPRSTRAHPS